MLFHSYLADQCWNGGFIYMIMLRRVKRKAPLPPCDVNGSVSTPISNDSCEDRQQGRAASEPSEGLVNCKRTRKFGVISRSSFNRDNRGNTVSDLQSCLPGDDSSSIEGSPDTFPQVKTGPQHLHSGGTATLPARFHSQLSEGKMDSFSSESSIQVRHIQSSNLIRNYRGQVRGHTTHSLTHTFILKTKDFIQNWDKRFQAKKIKC